MYTPSIEKLQKKLEKEPNSLIFLQLAEEYRKEGYYEDALKTCRDGLKRHPNYWSARVAMGRIFYEMADYELARDELEKVIKAVPDNLLANKLLGDIYLHTDRPEDSLKRYQIVQMLTPNDQDVVANIRKLEATLSQKQGTQSMPVPEKPGRPSAPEFKAHPQEVDVASTAEIPAFPDMQISNDERQLANENFSASPLPGQHQYQSFTSKEASENLEKTSPVIFFDARSVTAEEDLTSQTESEDSSPIDPSKSAHESFPSTSVTDFSSFGTDLAEEEPRQESAKTEDQTQPMDEKEEDVSENQADELTTQTLAELYVQQGLADKAVKVYQKLLLNDPGNMQIINRLKELNPADSLLTSTGLDERAANSGKIRHLEETEDVYPSHSKSQDQLSEERRKKISTLENWLSSIRRERP